MFESGTYRITEIGAVALCAAALLSLGMLASCAPAAPAESSSSSSASSSSSSSSVSSASSQEQVDDAAKGSPEGSSGAYAENRVIVQFKQGTNPDAVRSALSAANVANVDQVEEAQLTNDGYVVIDCSPLLVPQAIEALQQQDCVEFVQLDYVYTLME